MMKIGEYEPLSPLQTAGSGNALWCIANKNSKRYFLKQFLAPVQPVQPTKEPSKQVRLRRNKCELFEKRRLALYDALKQINNDSIVHIEDFFVYNGHYYAASRWIENNDHTLDHCLDLPSGLRIKLLYSLAFVVQLIHDAGIVHGDLKPDHIVINDSHKDLKLYLLDFDSGFFENRPPDDQSAVDVDPVYMSPEAYYLIAGSETKLTQKIDTFAFGILMHQVLTGELPDFDHTRYAYIYAAVLDGAGISLSRKLSIKQRKLIRKMLHKKPSRRPNDKIILKKLHSMLK